MTTVKALFLGGPYHGQRHVLNHKKAHLSVFAPLRTPVSFSNTSADPVKVDKITYFRRHEFDDTLLYVVEEINQEEALHLLFEWVVKAFRLNDDQLVKHLGPLPLLAHEKSMLGRLLQGQDSKENHEFDAMAYALGHLQESGADFETVNLNELLANEKDDADVQ